MIQETDSKEAKGLVNMILIFGWVILFFHLYVFCHGSLEALGLPLGIFDTFIRAINRSTHLFNATWTAKTVALVVLAIYTLGSSGHKKMERTWNDVFLVGAIGGLVYYGNVIFLYMTMFPPSVIGMSYTLTTFGGYLLLMKAGGYIHQIINTGMMDDPMNLENETFEQESTSIVNEYSVNIPLVYRFKKKIRNGWVSVVNPFRATLVMGTPGSGKSFAVMNNFIRQHIEKGFALYLYDFKFPDLTEIAYYYAVKNAHVYQKLYNVPVQFFVINFDDPRRSHRVNPLAPELMTDILDAKEAAKTILLNLNKTWIQKSGDFFVDSAINFLQATIWYMKKYHEKTRDPVWLATIRRDLNLAEDDNFEVCTFPHVIEFLSRAYEEIFPLMLVEPELENITRPFASALEKGALEQLEGQIASARIPLASLSTKTLYWVMTANDFTLDINNRQAPKILCVGNNIDRQEAYGAALGLINGRLVKTINRKGRIPSSIIVDELPTIYFRGLDTLIATARGNKVSTTLGIQDYSQLKRDYGDKDAEAIFNTIGNIFSGAVNGSTAKNLSSRFGKNVQMNLSQNYSQKEVTTNMSTRLDTLIPESTISTLSQGEFVGTVADNFGENIKQKIFHGQLVVSKEQIAELSALEPIPMLPQWDHVSDKEVDEMLQANYLRVKEQVAYIIRTELTSIRKNDDTKHLLRGLRTQHEDYLTREPE